MHESPPTNVQITPVAPHKEISVSPTWHSQVQKWHLQRDLKSPIDNSMYHNSYYSTRSMQTNQEQSPGGASSGSCHGENSTGHVTPHDISPTSRVAAPCYWRDRNTCLFSTFDTSQHTSEELYKAAYGSYYQQLAASAARTYSHIQTPAKLTNFYYNNPYSRLAGTYAAHFTGS